MLVFFTYLLMFVWVINIYSKQTDHVESSSLSLQNKQPSSCSNLTETAHSSSLSISTSSCTFLSESCTRRGINKIAAENSTIANSQSNISSNNWLVHFISRASTAVLAMSQQLLSSSASLIGVSMLNQSAVTHVANAICLDEANVAAMESVTIANNNFKIDWERYFELIIYRLKCVVYISLTLLLFWLFISAL